MTCLLVVWEETWAKSGLCVSLTAELAVFVSEYIFETPELIEFVWINLLIKSINIIISSLRINTTHFLIASSDD